MRHFSGEFSGVRLLMLDELEAIAGGEGEDTDDVPTDFDTITVHGEADGSDTFFVPLFWTTSPFGGGSGGGDSNPETVDQESVHVDVNFGRNLTETEQKAVDALNDTIQEINKTLNHIPDNARITLSNGQTVTGQELKQIWAKTDIGVNDVGHRYANNSYTSEANYNGGNPQVNVNINVLVNYNAVPGGMNFFALHELGHMTEAGRNTHMALNAGGMTAAEHQVNERLANDIARAIANNGGMPILPATGPQAPTQGGYSPNTPVFQTPAPAPPPPSGGGGGGGGGGDGGRTVLY